MTYGLKIEIGLNELNPPPKSVVHPILDKDYKPSLASTYKPKRRKTNNKS